MFLDKPDVYRWFFIEQFTGTESYSRPFWSYSIPVTDYIGSLWREPVPFDLSSEYGVAIAHQSDHCWLSTSYGVWRAQLIEESIDLTADVLSLRQETFENYGHITVELRNDDARYASLPSPLDIGCQLDISPGYVTTEGNEVSSGLAYVLEAYEYTSSGGKASLLLHGRDAWSEINSWRARHQFHWNKASEEMSVKQILEFLLSRVGLKLEVKSQSSVITGYYPNFTIHRDNRGDILIRRLLSFVPDVLFIEGGKVYVVSPQPTDSPAYSYGQDHPVFEGRYRQAGWDINRVKVEGYDPVGEEPVVVDSFSWDQITSLYDRLDCLED
ncbi:MAG: hypothetical protein JSW16_02860, partial [Dehalococcoidales bacterium]